MGLAATQVLQLVETLREAGRLDSLQLLHFHLGSQMANIRDIATGVRESARFYVELHKLGVNIQCFDVGGGLGVDYEGTRSQSDCSVNYGSMNTPTTSSGRLVMRVKKMVCHIRR